MKTLKTESILKRHVVILHNDVPRFVSQSEILKIPHILHAFHIFKKLQLGCFFLALFMIEQI